MPDKKNNMLRFFRKMRNALIPESRFGRYFFYAVGEILLVVIGILIAVQINNLNSFRIDRQMEREYLENFLEELKKDSIYLDVSLKELYPQKIKGLKLARDYAKYETVVTDTVGFLQAVGKGGLLSRGVVFEESSTYKDIISTGNLKLIRDKKLQLRIIRYYSSISSTNIYIDNLRSEYATFINSANPFDPLGNFQSDSKDYERALRLMKKDEFLSLANQEITFGFSLYRQMESVKRRLIPLLDSIKTELVKFN